jgi:2-dehydro-3-deoxyglucarate aldolase/4-hydroxy-2-oxoheptanedioate aldolase
MNPRLQKIRRKMDGGEPVVGVFVLLADSSVSEIVGYAGCDFAWIDSEHGMIDRREIYHHIMAAQAAGACAFVRVPGVNADQIKHILDMGPDGVIFPFVNNAEIAREAVAACTYPSGGGRRGIGPLRAIHYGIESEPEYLKTSREETMLIFQIETAEAAENLEAIAAVPGYDSLFVGPADLGMSLVGLSPAEKAARIEEVTIRAGEIARRHGKYLGSCAGPTKESVRALMGKGCHWMTIAQDVRIISGMLAQAVRGIHG